MRILHIVGTMSAEAGGPVEAVRMLVECAPPDPVSEVVTCDNEAATLPCPVHALGSKRPGFYYSRALLPWLRANRSRFDSRLRAQGLCRINPTARPAKANAVQGKMGNSQDCGAPRL